MRSFTVIYVPGLFDRTRALLALQRAALRLWRPWGARVDFFVVGWADDAEYEDRLDSLIARVDAHRSQGREVVLVGASAGASAVLGAFAHRREDVVGVAVICGKIHRPHIIPGPVLDINEVFEEALEAIDDHVESLTAGDLARVLSLRAVGDAIVPPEDTIIPGAVNRRMTIVGHISGIAWALLVHGERIMRFFRGLPTRPSPAR
ncbi:hypothetical protein [Jonesia quinghaiensis]|uniref:hypothetical protein n=1 Tax=Jonesia quinghaiensis TaxID=262806 RepID=UPI00041CB625|nr:hypothetical protein [Jonesia quinghaiensis]